MASAEEEGSALDHRAAPAEGLELVSAASHQEGSSDRKKGPVPMIHGWHNGGEIVVRWFPDAPACWGRQLFVAAGVNTEGKSQLKHTHKDARAMAAVLKNAGYENHGVLLEENADTIRESVEAMCNAAGEGDHLVFYFSGHGVRGRAQKKNSHTNDLGLYCKGQSELGLMEVTQLMNKSQAKTCLVILDCCQSGNTVVRGAGDTDADGSSSAEGDLGGAIEESLRLAGVPLQTLPCAEAATRGAAEDDYQHAEGLLVLSACADKEAAHEGSEHGVFTGFVLEALGESADTGVTTVTALLKQVRSKMGNHTAPTDGADKGAPGESRALSRSVGKQIIALSIGIDAYTSLPKLSRAVRDAAGVEKGFGALEYAKVLSNYDARTCGDLLSQVNDEVCPRIEAQGPTLRAVVVFVAAHCTQVGEDIYIIPGGVEHSKIRFESVKLAELVQMIVGSAEAASKCSPGEDVVCVFIVDGCRSEGWDRQQLKVSTADGYLKGKGCKNVFLFSTGKGTDAKDVSPFAAVVLKQMLTPGTSLSWIHSALVEHGIAAEITSAAPLEFQLCLDTLGELRNVPALPDGLALRPEVVRQLKDGLQAPGTLAVIGCSKMAVAGMGGAGKTTMAKLLCHDQGIRQQFSDGVVWLTVGKGQQDGIYSLQCRLLQQLLSHAPQAAKEALERTKPEGRPDARAAQEQLGMLLGGPHKYLVVLDDVWEAEVLERTLPQRSLLHSRVVVTTRNRGLIPGVEPVEVGMVDERTASEVLLRGIEVPPERRECADKLVKRCGGHLHTLAVCRGMILGARTDGLRGVLGKLERGVAQQKKLDGYGDSVFGALQASFDDLANIEPVVKFGAEWTAGQLQEFLCDLCVFPEDTRIPRSTLYTMQHGCLESEQVDEMLKCLGDRSLVSGTEEAAVVWLHDNTRDFLLRLVGSFGYAAARHSKLLESYEALCAKRHGVPDWSTGPQDLYLKDDSHPFMHLLEEARWEWIGHHVRHVSTPDRWLLHRDAQVQSSALLSLADQPVECSEAVCAELERLMSESQDPAIRVAAANVLPGLHKEVVLTAVQQHGLALSTGVRLGGAEGGS
eukprot:TRINITY_DN1571_c0_g1_i2.p1 TRINITY_DN1571_c0_g1~~TRINITY_DN1571_c0_g1_i2.p1  ORF type:complete len:1076 (-),score=276.13 TRINITY_DN1571_c0_g1_i2:174-3401(-)